MKFTNRDIELLNFINEFGFCEILQIEKRFNLKKSRAYQIMKRLENACLIKLERIFYGRNGVYTLTSDGARCTDLPPIHNIPKDNYIHQLTVINTYLNLMKQFPESTWLSERRLRRDKSIYGVGNKIKHIADGILIFSDKQIAIEVELTMKSLQRLEDIIFSYAIHDKIKEVWYYCSHETIKKVQRAAETWKHIKIYPVI